MSGVPCVDDDKFVGKMVENLRERLLQVLCKDVEDEPISFKTLLLKCIQRAPAWQTASESATAVKLSRATGG
jgi:hypothetical protein